MRRKPNDGNHSNSLSVLQMPLDNPPVLEECVRSLVIPKIDTFSRVANDISGAWIRRGAISNKLLKVCDVIWRDYILVRKTTQASEA
jgi:hypothetical protein